MLLKHLKLKNFRQYKGEQKIEFSTDREKNITVILGDNTSGKTTFVQAFNWILYSNVEFQTRSLLNMEIASQMENGSYEEVVGEIVFEHEDLEYKLIRKERYTKRINSLSISKSDKTLCTFTKEGKMEAIKSDEIDEVINSILPANLSNYFFFDGEKIEKISEKRDVGNAVRNILGLQAMEMASKHLNPDNKSTVPGKFRGAIQTSADTDYKNAQKSFDNYNEEKTSLLETLKILDEEIEQCENKIDEVKEELIAFKGLEEYQKKQKRAKEYRNRSQESLNKNIDMYKSRISEDLGTYLTQGLYRRAIDKIEASNCVDEGVPNLTNKSIEFLLKRGKCICGSDLEPGSLCYEHILKEQRLVPPQSVGTTVKYFKKEIENSQRRTKSFYSSVNHYFEEITQAKRDILEFEEEINKLEEKIVNADKGNRLARQLQDLKITLSRKQGQKVQKMGRIEFCNNEIQKAKEIMKKHIGASEDNKVIKTYLAYAEALYKYFVSSYESKEKELREKLNVSVNEIFKEMYHGTRSVCIKENYTVDLIAKDELLDIEGLKLDESRGLETVKNFAFISGILKLAKEKLATRGISIFEDEEESQEIIYPLVMDAPFSNADEKHVSKISSVLPNVADQIIMVVMEKDWRYAEETISGRVGKSYKINKMSETESYIRGNV